MESKIKLWIARDKNGELFFYVGEKPFRRGDIFIVKDSGYFNLYIELFPEVTWENSPQQVELKLIKE